MVKVLATEDNGQEIWRATPAQLRVFREVLANITTARQAVITIVLSDEDIRITARRARNEDLAKIVKRRTVAPQKGFRA